LEGTAAQRVVARTAADGPAELASEVVGFPDDKNDAGQQESHMRKFLIPADVHR
jgi:hypothetical protein